MLASASWTRLTAAAFAALMVLLLIKVFGESSLFAEFNFPRLSASDSAKAHPDAHAVEHYVNEEEYTPPTLKVANMTTVSNVALEAGSLPSDAPPQHPAPSSSTSIHGMPAASEPSAARRRKTLVMGKLLSDDTEWAGKQLSDWEQAIYIVNLPANASSPTGLRTKVNKAKEAFVYLTYIVDHYNDLPDVAVFIHSHRKSWPKAWHNDAPGYDAVIMLQQLRLETVEKRGYVNLRCIREPGCPQEIDLHRSPPDFEKKTEMVYPFIYAEMFNMTVDAVREQVPVVATPCCAQFAVTRAQIMMRPKSEYERFQKIIEESDIEDDTLGRVMEYTWHIIFGMNAVHCDDTKTCWREVYGRVRN